MTFLGALTPRVTIEGPVEEPALRAAEARLGCRLSPALRSLLAQTGGFSTDEFGPRDLWRLDEIVAVNEQLRYPSALRSKDGSWADRLCFGDDVAGGYFYVGPTNTSVHVWNFIDREGHLLASDLATFYRGWLSGSLNT